MADLFNQLRNISTSYVCVRFDLNSKDINKITSIIKQFMFDNIFAKLSCQILFATKNNL